MGVFFCKKWTFPQRRVHHVQYQYFLFYLFEGVRTHPTHPFPPTDLCQTYRQRQTLLFNWLRLIAQDGLSTRIFVVSMHALTSGFQASWPCSSFARRWILVFFQYSDHIYILLTTFTVSRVSSLVPSFLRVEEGSVSRTLAFDCADHRCKNVFYVFLFWSRFYVFNVLFLFSKRFLFLKTLAKFRAARRLTRSNFKVTATK